MGKTTIQLDDETADRLYERKARGESYDDVVRRLLGETGGEHSDREGATPRDQSVEDSGPEIVVPESVPQRIAEADARAAIAATLELVASNGGVQRAEIIEEIAPEHPLGYDDIGPRGAWWRKVIRPALEESCRYENGVGWVQAGES
jgi:predicted CopG family antitoxin